MVVKLNSISQAADALNMSRTAASKRMLNLEYNYGGQLLERTANSVKVTKFGREFEKFAKLVIQKNNEIRSFQKDRFSICTTHSFATNTIPEVLEVFLEQYPDLMVKIIVSDDFSEVSADQVDVFVGGDNIPFLNLVKEALPSDWDMGLYAHSDYLKKNGEPQSLLDLDHHDLISFSDDESGPLGIGAWPLYVGKQKNDSWRKPKIVANSVTSMVSMCQKGLGIIGVTNPSRIRKDYGLTQVLKNISGQNVSTCIAYQADSKKIDLIKNFKKSFNLVWGGKTHG